MVHCLDSLEEGEGEDVQIQVEVVKLGSSMLGIGS
jgi:hypothetical protein